MFDDKDMKERLLSRLDRQDVELLSNYLNTELGRIAETFRGRLERDCAALRDRWETKNAEVNQLRSELMAKMAMADALLDQLGRLGRKESDGVVTLPSREREGWSASVIVRSPRLRSATWPAPQREARGRWGRRRGGVGR